MVLLVSLALGRVRRRRQRQRRRRQRLVDCGSGAAGGIQKNAKNASTKLTIGSKNFTEQKVLGEIYAQALAAAGYDVSAPSSTSATRRRRSRRSRGATSAPIPSTPARRCCRSSATPPTRSRRTGWWPTTKAKQGFAKKDLTALPPDPVRELERGGRDEGDGRQVRAEEDLRPVQGREQADAVRKPGVPPAAGLPARPPEGLRAEVQEVRPGRHRPAPRGAREGPGRRVDRVHHRPADQAGGRSSCWRTTRACSRPTTPRW